MTQLARQLQTTKMSKQVRWTVQQEEKLIELWREKECLYDVSSQLYHDRVKKEAAWREITLEIQIPGEITYLVLKHESFT